jgi:hypothetical protein
VGIRVRSKAGLEAISGGVGLGRLAASRELGLALDMYGRECRSIYAGNINRKAKRTSGARRVWRRLRFDGM